MARGPSWLFWILMNMSDAREASIQEAIPAADNDSNQIQIGEDDLNHLNTEYRSDMILGVNMWTYSAEARNESMISPSQTIERRGIRIQGIRIPTYTYETVSIGDTDSEGDVRMLAPSDHIQDLPFGQLMTVNLSNAKRRKGLMNPHRTGYQPTDEVGILCHIQEPIYDIRSTDRIWVYTQYFAALRHSYTSAMNRQMIRHTTENPYGMQFSQLRAFAANWVDDFCFQLFFGNAYVFSISHDYLTGDYTIRGDHTALRFIDRMFYETFIDTIDREYTFPFGHPDTIKLINLAPFFKSSIDFYRIL